MSTQSVQFLPHNDPTQVCDCVSECVPVWMTHNCVFMKPLTRALLEELRINYCEGLSTRHHQITSGAGWGNWQGEVSWVECPLLEKVEAQLCCRVLHPPAHQLFFCGLHECDYPSFSQNSCGFWMLSLWNSNNPHCFAVKKNIKGKNYFFYCLIK